MNGSLKALQIADEVDEIIGAFTTTMVGWMLTGGNDGGGVFITIKISTIRLLGQSNLWGVFKPIVKRLQRKNRYFQSSCIIKSGNDSYNNF